MAVGSNERRWAWMDEGLVTFMNQYSRADFYDDGIDGILQENATEMAEKMSDPPSDQSIMTYPDRMPASAISFLGYRKPANGLMLLREYIIGPDRFDSAFQAYFDRWRNKHPRPADFFQTIATVTGEDLDWFWRGWFYETAVVDQALAEVTPGTPTKVLLRQNEALMLPMKLKVTYADGSTEKRRIPSEAFSRKDTGRLHLREGTGPGCGSEQQYLDVSG